jgi:hypothetical protein
MVQGVPQDPQKFLAAGRDLPVVKVANAARVAGPVMNRSAPR